MIYDAATLHVIYEGVRYIFWSSDILFRAVYVFLNNAFLWQAENGRAQFNK